MLRSVLLRGFVFAAANAGLFPAIAGSKSVLWAVHFLCLGLGLRFKVGQDMGLGQIFGIQ